MKYSTQLSYIFYIISALLIMYSILLIINGENENRNINYLEKNAIKKYTRGLIIQLNRSCDNCTIYMYNKLYSDKIKFPSEIHVDNGKFLIYSIG